MKNLPKTIYLQIGADDLSPEALSELDFDELNDVGWCEDEIYDTDIEYVLTDKNNKDAPSVFMASNDEQFQIIMDYLHKNPTKPLSGVASMSIIKRMDEMHIVRFIYIPSSKRIMPMKQEHSEKDITDFKYIIKVL